MNKPRLLTWISTRLAPRAPEFRLRRYCWLALLSTVVVWVTAGAYLWAKPDSYLSEWTLVLPDRSDSSSLALSNIGNASFSNSSPFGNIGQNPLLTYQKFATSATVLRSAATMVGLTQRELGTPRIKLIPQTPLMEFQIKGATPEMAAQAGEAIIWALNNKLDNLRQEELRERDRHRSHALSSYEAELARSRRDVLHHQSTTNLVTTNQFETLAESIERQRGVLTEVRAERDRMQGYLQNLYTGIDVDAETARAAVKLQSREDLRSLLSGYATLLVEVATVRAKVGSRHPDLLAKQASMAAMQDSLQKAVGDSLGRAPETLRDVALLSTRSETGEMLRLIVNVSAELAGLVKKEQSLVTDLVAMNQRLQEQAKSAAILADLERDHSIAEAVFSSALGRVSTEKFNVLTAYPLIQVFAPPTRPSAVDQRPAIIAWIGAAGITGCLFIGLFIMWLREPMWRRITTQN